MGRKIQGFKVKVSALPHLPYACGVRLQPGHKTHRQVMHNTYTHVALCYNPDIKHTVR